MQQLKNKTALSDIDTDKFKKDMKKKYDELYHSQGKSVKTIYAAYK